ncbi:L-asparaginase precursor [Massariosphaeria phaeospora]|uniref:L-asparaginase n=1 Tax=Massariosphaeria phaeospora TaxID=100035 RepID=A0A7C8M3R7_9PLEO|nr:L-asparaginase precursor [Massariosphaeria phaeospora]
MDKVHHPSSQLKVTPRIIIHGGAGNITRQTISKEKYDRFQTSQRRILASANRLLSQPGATALDVATHAVSLLENDTLYNSGKGAVFTREGHNELECSIMVSNGYRKRSIGCMMLQHVKNPIKLARELLIRGEMPGGDGSQDHCQYSGAFVESLAQKWGLEIVQPSYFFTQQRWDEHQRGLKEKAEASNGSAEMSEWEKENYIPLGTCGAVVLDSEGTICVATSTGGLTNKVPGRIGDTPTTGAGFWAEEWYEPESIRAPQMVYTPSPITTPLEHLSRGNIRALALDCLPAFIPSSNPPETPPPPSQIAPKTSKAIRHAIGISGTGNGDSFLKLAAARTVAANARFARTSLSHALPWMSGPGGELQKSAGDRWDRTHEGTGGMIGIEVVGGRATVVQDFNCGGMVRAWTEEDGRQECLIFREDSYESG